MKMKTAKILGILISVLVLFVSCGQIADGNETEVTITLPYVAGTGRAIDSGKKDDLIEATKSYRVHMNDRVIEGTGGKFSAYFAVGLKVDIYVECLNSNRDVIVRTGVKSIVVKNKGNSVDFNLMADGEYIPPSSGDNTSGGNQPVTPPPPTIEYVNITFNQGFVYTNTVHQPPSTWIAMTGAALPNGGQREKGSSASSDQASATNYVFKGWVENSQSPSGGAPNTQSFNYVQNYNDNMTLYAIWEQVEPGNHNVKFAAGTTTGSSVSGLPQGFQQKEGAPATFTGTPTCPGYEFAGWSASPNVNMTSSGSSWEFTMPTSDVTLTALWNVITYTVSYDDGQGASPKTETFTVASGGTNVTLKAANTFTRTGYTLSKWSAGNNNYNPNTAVTKTALIALAVQGSDATHYNVTFTAQWTANTYKITYSNKNGGTGNADTANATTSFTVETPTITLATEGTLEKMTYRFAGWETSNGIDVNSMNAAQLIALITSGDTLALQVKWENWKRTVLYTDGTLIINELPEARKSGATTAVYAAMKDDGSNYVFSSYNSSLWYSNRTSITSVEIGSDISPTSTEYWFYGMSNCASINLAKLQTSNVTSMYQMFYGCSALATLTFGNNFNTSKVTNMSGMFNYCSNLSTLDVSTFNTSNVTDMSKMFSGCSSLQSLNLSSFNTSNVTNMMWMFSSCSSLITFNFGANFNTSRVTDMSLMFYQCSNLSTLDVNFNTSNVTTMANMFEFCTKLTTLTFGANFDTSNVTDMRGMFSDTGLESLNLSMLKTSKVTTMSKMFHNSSSLGTLTFGANFDTSNVTDMNLMFFNCSSLATLDVSQFNTSKVTDMRNMFYGCSSLTTLDVGFNTSNVTNMKGMFNNCSGLTTLTFGSNFTASKVTDMGGMFANLQNLTQLDLSNFNTSSVTDMSGMFSSTGLTRLTLGNNFDTSSVTTMSRMFDNCTTLQTIYAVRDFVLDNADDTLHMFSLCQQLRGGNSTRWTNAYTDGTYARIDATDKPGYFTQKR